MKTKLSTLISSKLAFKLLALTFTTLTLTFTECSNDDEDDIIGLGERKQLAQPVTEDFSAMVRASNWHNPWLWTSQQESLLA